MAAAVAADLVQHLVRVHEDYFVDVESSDKRKNRLEMALIVAVAVMGAAATAGAVKVGVEAATESLTELLMLGRLWSLSRRSRSNLMAVIMEEGAWMIRAVKAALAVVGLAGAAVHKVVEERQKPPNH